MRLMAPRCTSLPLTAPLLTHSPPPPAPPPVQELRLRDFALVPSAAVAFGPGLVAISGQSGAGKSVLLDALGQLMGAAAAQDCVRPPAEVAVVEGAWWCGPEAAAAAGALLREMGLPARALPGGDGSSSSSGGGMIHIRRQVRENAWWARLLAAVYEGACVLSIPVPLVVGAWLQRRCLAGG
jgi:hypothetical protein